MSPTSTTGRSSGRMIAGVVRSAAAHRVPLVAGEAAFFAALAVFPALLTVVAVVRAGSGLLGHGGGGLFTVGTVAALFLLVRALRSVLFALTSIAEQPLRRQWLWASVLAVGTLVGAALVLAAAVQDPLVVLGLPGARMVWDVLRWPVTAAALLLWAMGLLRIGLGCPRGPRRRFGLLVGAGIAAGGWIGASLVFPLYVVVAGRFTDTVGALGGGLILLLWLYLLMLVLYVGAEVCVALVGDGADVEDARPAAP